MEWRDHPLDATNPYQIGYDPQAQQLARTQSGLWIVFKLALKTLVYSPLLVFGYWLSQKILSKESEAIVKFILPVVCAIILYQLLMQCKLAIRSAKQRGSWWWLPVFILCIVFTCLLPAYLAFELISPLLKKMNGGNTITWLVIFCFTTYIYFQYDFLGHLSGK